MLYYWRKKNLLFLIFLGDTELLHFLLVVFKTRGRDGDGASIKRINTSRPFIAREGRVDEGKIWLVWIDYYVIGSRSDVGNERIRDSDVCQLEI